MTAYSEPKQQTGLAQYLKVLQFSRGRKSAFFVKGFHWVRKESRTNNSTLNFESVENILNPLIIFPTSKRLTWVFTRADQVKSDVFYCERLFIFLYVRNSMTMPNTLCPPSPVSWTVWPNHPVFLQTIDLLYYIYWLLSCPTSKANWFTVKRNNKYTVIASILYFVYEHSSNTRQVEAPQAGRAAGIVYIIFFFSENVDF